VSIDQEGGQVKRLSGAPTLSPPELGARNDPRIARKQGVATAKNLLSVGVNVDLAPVLDVGRRGSIMERQGRSYSRDPSRVKRIGGAFVRGLGAGHVAATGKHFPGLGSATKNQDLEVNRIGTPLNQLRKIDELPYAGIQPPLVMVSSAVYTALSAEPAVFSARVVTDELRGHAGFGGATISDALDAPAMARYGSPGRRALLATKAGTDLLLFSRAPSGATDAVVHAVRDGRLSRAALRESARRTLVLRASLKR
jgi:beta-N-acetylhexosaminidase